MLYELMRECRNYFVIDGAQKTGTFEIVGGSIGLNLLPGQYYLIEGSVLNDGLHQEWDALSDETFTGAVIPLAVPVAFKELAREIEEWNVKNTGSTGGGASPYQSESFAGYSYQRASGGSGGGSGSGQITWKEAFAARINTWRKL